MSAKHIIDEPVTRADNSDRAGRIAGMLYKVPGLDDGTIDKTALFARLRATADAVVRADTAGKASDDALVEAARKLLRSDSTAEVKSVVTPGSTQPAESKSDKDEEKDKKVTLADVLNAVGDMAKRLDAIEGKRGDNEDDKEKGKPEKLAADSDDPGFKVRMDAERRLNARSDDYRNDDAFASWQSKADSIATLFGQRAPRPVTGELLGSYMRRTVTPWKDLDAQWKHTDLRVMQVADPIGFQIAVDSILEAARKEGQRPSRVPAGFLAERVESRNGHTFTRFYGRPKSWLDGFMPRAQRVKRIHRMDERGNIQGVAYQRD